MIRSALAVLVAGTILGSGAYYAPEITAVNACATMTLSTCADLDTSAVTDLRGAPQPVPELTEVVAVATDDGAPADLIACWIASGAHGDPTDGSETLYAPRWVIDSCNPLGWVGA